MLVSFPVTLEDGTIINGTEESFRFEGDQKFNGTDADGNRVTNIVGFDGENLEKWCPGCGGIFLSVDFGFEGRATSPDYRRDQSYCNVCRARKYGRKQKKSRSTDQE